MPVSMIDPLQQQQQSLSPQVQVPAPTPYNFDDAIRRRWDVITGIGTQQNQAVADQQARIYQDRLNKIQSLGASQGGNIASPDGTVLPNDGSLRSRIVQAAAAQKGVPYVWGGTTTRGFDCSGLVQYVYKQMGISMPRIAAAQARMGTVVPINQLKPGDLVAWGSSPATASHIAIYAGNGQVWEAPRPGKSVGTRAVSQGSGIFGISVSRLG